MPMSQTYKKNQSRSCLVPSDQREKRLSWKAEVGFMDVHVKTSSPEGVGVHEG